MLEFWSNYSPFTSKKRVNLTKSLQQSLSLHFMASESSLSYTNPIVSVLRKISSVRALSYNSFKIHCNISIYIQIFQMLYLLRVPHGNLLCISPLPLRVTCKAHLFLLHLIHEFYSVFSTNHEATYNHFQSSVSSSY